MMQSKPSKQEINEEELAQQKQRRMVKMVLRQGMTSAARERLGRVKLANPQLAQQAEMVCLQVIQQGRRVNEKTLKTILERLTPKKEFRITRR